jgi:hypothetical protein
MPGFDWGSGADAAASRYLKQSAAPQTLPPGPKHELTPPAPKLESPPQPADA